MEHHRNSRRPGDITLSLTRDVIERLEGYRRQLEKRTPGISISMSAAARAALLHALGDDKVA